LVKPTNYCVWGFEDHAIIVHSRSLDLECILYKILLAIKNTLLFDFSSPP
ncbi:unnamed protein product, partial [Rotaria sp. Silwood1]